MTQINIHQAKTHFSALIEKALAGEDIVVARNGTPLVRLVPVQPTGTAWFGMDAGTGHMAEDFDDPLEEFFTPDASTGQ